MFPLMVKRFDFIICPKLYTHQRKILILNKTSYEQSKMCNYLPVSFLGTLFISHKLLISPFWQVAFIGPVMTNPGPVVKNTNLTTLTLTNLPPHCLRA